MIRVVKKLKYMGKLKPCVHNNKVLCVCKDVTTCTETKVEKVIEK